MVANLKMQMESYSNDELMHTLANEQEWPCEVVNTARDIVLERGLSQRNILERAKTFRAASQEATELLKRSVGIHEAVITIRDKYFLEEKTAKKIVSSSLTQENTPIMLKSFRFFMFGILLFYTIRIAIKLI